MYKRGDMVLVDASVADIYPYVGIISMMVAGVDHTHGGYGYLLFYDRGWEAEKGANYEDIETGDRVWWVSPEAIFGFDAITIEHQMLED